MTKKRFFTGIPAIVLVFGMALVSCGGNGSDDVFNDVRITITNIPSTHYDETHGAIISFEDYDMDFVLGAAPVSGGRVTFALEKHGEPWNGRGEFHIEIVFPLVGGDYWFTGGQDFADFLPSDFDWDNDDIHDYLPLFNITSARHTISLSQFRHSDDLPQP